MLKGTHVLPWIALSSQIKIPTASSEYNFGTGEFDYGIGLTFRKQLFSFIAFGDIGYLNLGDPEEITFLNFNIAKEYGRLLNLLKEERPDAVVHFAEQRAAPYSMKSPRHKIYTVDNNLNATHNVLCAIVESRLDIHVAHLGTMGVYGYSTSGMKIPEGYLDIKIPDGEKDIYSRILYPANPGSIYHMTKTQDALFFQFYNKNDNVRITDLHQGVVWGTNTPETLLDERLINRFDYDGDYGTVLNRFLMQAAIEYPLTVYGTGGQTRAFIHIRDTVRCIELALINAPKPSDPVHILNQTS